jgi:site-specific recombinase XerC
MGRRRKAWLVNNGTGKRLQNGNPLAGFYCEYNDYATGERVHRSKHFLTKKHAREWVRQYNARLDLQLIGEVIPIALTEAVEEYLRACTMLSQAAQTHYAVSLGLLTRHLPDGIQVMAITGESLDGFARARAAAKAAESTIAKDMRAIGVFIRWALDKGYISHDVTKDMKAAPSSKAHKRQRPTISDAQLERLVSAIDTPDRQVAAWLAMTAGLDRSVIENLTARQLDIDAKALRIVRPKTARRSGKTLVIPVHHDLWPQLAERAERTLADTPLLHGLKRQHRDRDWWALACKAAGLTGVLFRDLRAVAARRIQDGGGTLTDARDVLGHSTVAMTADHYSVPNPSARKAIDKLPLPAYQAEAKSKSH